MLNPVEEFKKKYASLRNDQKPIFDEMQEDNRLNICSPTGFGKGYIMISDLLKNVVYSDYKKYVIATHRLMLNTQHMDDIIKELESVLKDVIFIFLGSKEYAPNDEVKKVIKRQGYINHKEIIKNTLSKFQLNNLVTKYSKDKKIIIITTYHSMDKLSDVTIDRFYCDEAHLLATSLNSESDRSFRNNFNKLTYKSIYYFTATPKDCVDYVEDDEFLMNNERIFGRRIGITLKQAIDGAYITKPLIHIAIPENFEEERKDSENLLNITNFIMDCYENNLELVKENSIMPDEIESKLLVRCKNVDQMWALNDMLLDRVDDDITVFAGASRKGNGSECYEQDGVVISKDEHLERLQALPDTQKSIVLHVDTLSEGVNVEGFTGVMFLSDVSPTVMKLLQNVGRGLRLTKSDRSKIRKNLINANNYSPWIKPFSYIILPIYSQESHECQQRVAKSIVDLRDKGIDSNYTISFGSDIAKGILPEPVPYANEEPYPDPRRRMIENIEHQIETYESILREESYVSMEEYEKIDYLCEQD